MQISSLSKFIIYGAGTRGKEYCKVIKENNMNVIAFIDRSAEKLQNVMGIPVYTLEDLCRIFVDRDEILVVISVTNVFLHFNIAETIYNFGFRYIIYKELYDYSLYSKEINRAYLAISMPNSKIKIKGLEIPLFAIHETERDAEEVREESEQLFITRPVPIDLLFGLSKDFYLSAVTIQNEEMIDKIPDKSLLYFTISKDMMRGFSDSVSEEDWNNCIELYFKQRRCMEEDRRIDPDREDAHLRERYSIFQNMELLYNTNINFFYENPIDVKWNQKGYFNIEDGNNRAAFLFAKGWNMLPCRMEKEDHCLWINEKKVDAVKESIKNVQEVEYPISHPFYIKSLYKSMPFCYIKLKKLCDWLYKKDVVLDNKSILDVECRNGFIGRHFARMGANVTALETDEANRELCMRIDDLLYIKQNIVKDCNDLDDRRFHIVLIPVWGSKNFNKYLEYAQNILIIDTYEPDFLFSDSVLSEDYTMEEVCSLFYDNKIMHTVILQKMRDL